MAENILRDQLRGFFGGKSIQTAYDFIVRFNLSRNGGNSFLASQLRADPLMAKFESQGIDFPVFEWHVKNVVLPNNSFKKELQKQGIFGKTFPVLESEGLELKVEFEEDSDHNIGLFIQYLQRRIMSQDGVYENPNNSYINSIDVIIGDRISGQARFKYSFKDCYFLNASEPNYAYANNEAISYVVTFGTDNFDLVVL